MRLSWNEIRSRAAEFARKWEGAGYEKGETQLFYRDFFDVFGMSVRRVATFEEPVKLLGDKRGFIDLFWKGVLLVEQKSAGRDLGKAKTQALSYFPGLKDTDLPRYILLSDFRTFELYDLDEDEHVSFALEDLPAHVEKFGFILGVQKRTFKDQDPVNIEAAERVGNLHDALEASGYKGHDLEQFLVRIVFCLFADDTGIFEPRDIFLDLLENRTREDGSDLGGWLAQLFQVLDTPEDERSGNLDEDLGRFPYVNGDLFDGPLRIPSFDASMRERLLDACQFDWSNISPAIFGSLFQSVMDRNERRRQGAHYTTEKNILKVIEPLFLDDLRAEFARLKTRRDSRRLPELLAFQQRLGRLRFLDPACGCGNFLIIAYRELRALEIEVLKETRPRRQIDVLASLLSVVNVDQFYGIELGEFPVRIAEVALWMMDHIMNNRLSLEFGETYVRIPLKTSPHIVHGDALEMDWAEVLPPEDCSYVLGNPPFGGFVMRIREKQVQAKALMARLGASGSRLDYVAAWFLKAGEYFRGKRARIGFVATNSITQGEQVAQLWPALFDRYNLEIAFAHRTFAWGSDARGMAHVHVVIIGLYDRESIASGRRLFTYQTPTEAAHEIQVSAISPYLIDAGHLTNPHLVVKRQRTSMGHLPKIRVGTKPVDGGHYIFREKEKADFVALEPQAVDLLRPFVGSAEYINDRARWILHVSGQSPALLRSLPNVMERIHTVRHYRAEQAGRLGQSLAERPTEYHVSVIPETAFLVIPETSSERRQYVPIGWLNPPTIPSNALLVMENAQLWQFAILTSAMHMAWLRYIGGRLKSDYRYSSGLVYNTFPMPPRFHTNSASIAKLEPLAQAVLDARAAHPDSSLADLYDPDLMPPNLRKAHQALDRAVDRLYRRSGFASKRERVEYLLGLYEKMMEPLVVRGVGRRRG